MNFIHKKELGYTSEDFPQIGHQISNSIQNALENKKPNLNSMPSDGVINMH